MVKIEEILATTELSIHVYRQLRNVAFIVYTLISVSLMT